MRRTEREAAYVEFATARRDRLRRIAYGMCGDWHRADDLVQNALVKLYVAWPRVHRSGTEDAYVRRVLFNAAIDDSRRAVRRERPTEVLPETAGRVGVTVEDRDSLVAALQQLPAQQRATVLLRHWLGLSVAEVAAELGISEGTVKSHTSRGLSALRGALSVVEP
ncbi:SigE family RNA polymerase sigma factor [Nocardioides sp. zg-536]|uniref:SigE family RNA polymerase sigma factor n=1 Tax=Nocardioides faecalis TaxID=2803858 RepID=A0A938Y3E9_9ACTN|nr:SigE family RNA polymerase sigma factor [Nocardioides faecalis]MBM9458510.1 SigE family RNA polymerase sigma factor [Nocardioides faecalis]QVI58518.1 SigE family RNA polymerase sigma factor [Nocardioides faecalis]